MAAPSTSPVVPYLADAYNERRGSLRVDGSQRRSHVCERSRNLAKQSNRLSRRAMITLSVVAAAFVMVASPTDSPAFSVHQKNAPIRFVSATQQENQTAVGTVNATILPSSTGSVDATQPSTTSGAASEAANDSTTTIPITNNSNYNPTTTTVFIPLLSSQSTCDSHTKSSSAAEDHHVGSDAPTSSPIPTSSCAESVLSAAPPANLVDVSLITGNAGGGGAANPFPTNELGAPMAPTTTQRMPRSTSTPKRCPCAASPDGCPCVINFYTNGGGGNSGLVLAARCCFAVLAVLALLVVS